MITVSTVPEVRILLERVGQGAVLFLDVDDTLITPSSKVFRSKSPHRTLIDDLKKNQDITPNFETILSRWRLQRKIQLVSEEWPCFIADFKKKFPVYALTKMESGPVGEIPSMEEWRYQELFSQGIEFTPLYGQDTQSNLLSSPSKPYDALFHKGIFLTGSYDKSAIVRSYLQKKAPTQVVFIDDRIEYLEDVSAECSRQEVPYLGILFAGEKLISGDSHADIAALQTRHLLAHAEWLEDGEAERRLATPNGKRD